MEENELDLVGIATESGLHAEIALYCIEHNINVIIEKPMAMSMEDADEIIRRSKEKGVKVSACIRIGLILQFKNFVKLLNLADSENFRMERFMYDGIGGRNTTNKLPGEALGNRTAAL